MQGGGPVRQIHAADMYGILAAAKKGGASLQNNKANSNNTNTW
jgi:hypothetical protein